MKIDIEYSSIEKKQLLKTSYDNCTFHSCDFSDLNLTDFVFIACEFNHCNLSSAKLINTAFREVTFNNCKLLGLHFEDCNEFLFNIYLNDSIVDFSSFFKRKMKKAQFINSSFKEADFSETDLSESSFKNCDLNGTTFDNTNLEKADLRTAKNYSIDTESNRLTKAKFSYDGLAGLLDKYNIKIER